MFQLFIRFNVVYNNIWHHVRLFRVSKVGRKRTLYNSYSCQKRKREAIESNA